MENSLTSILTSVKKLLGITEDYTPFDTDITIHINSALAALEQMGVGQPGFAITGDTETWDDFLGDASDRTPNLEMIKSYVYMRVKLIFDPPTSGTVVEAYNNAIAEFEWRAHVAVETPYLGGTAPKIVADVYDV